jgi:hypothetical protein
MVASGGGIAGLGRKRQSGAHLESDLHRENERVMGNLMGRSTWRRGGWRRAHGGEGRTGCPGEKSWIPYHTTELRRLLVVERERQRGGAPELGSGGGGLGLGFCEAEAARVDRG